MAMHNDSDANEFVVGTFTHPTGCYHLLIWLLVEKETEKASNTRRSRSGGSRIPRASHRSPATLRTDTRDRCAAGTTHVLSRIAG